MVTNVKLAAAYLRKSTEEDDRQIESFAGQQREIERYAEAQGYAIVKWYREAYTGTETKRRKVFLEMLSDAQTKSLNFSYIICYDISRFGRLDNDEAGYWRHEFRKHGVEVVYAVENLQGDDTDDLIVSTKQWLAREYSRKIGEYVCRNIVSRSGDAKERARAFNIGRAAPFGYDTLYLDKDGKPHTIVRQMADRSKEIFSAEGQLLRTLPAGTRFQKADTDLMALVPSLPERVEAVRRIFHLYVDENLGQFSIVNRLNAELKKGLGCPPTRGGQWSIGSVQEILKNGHYAGDTVFNRRSMGKFFKLTQGEKGVEAERLPKSLPTVIRRNPKADWIVIPGTHEPLVSRETFDAAIAKRRIRHTDSSQSRTSLRSKYLFSGKLVCAECGFRYQGVTKRKKDWSKEGYICGGYKLRGKHTCQEHFLPSEIIEPAVFNALEAEVMTLDLSGAVGKAGKALAGAPAAAKRHKEDVTRELAKVEERLETLVDCITPENKDIITGKMVALRAERDRLKAELGDHAAIEAKAIASTQLVSRLVKLANDLKTLWDVATVTEKREFLSCLTESISISARRKTAEIRLSSNYLELKRIHDTQTGKSFLLDGRGDWRSFEPLASALTPFLTAFQPRPEPYLASLPELTKTAG